MVNELHDWMEKYPHIIQPPNVSDSLFIKTNGTILLFSMVRKDYCEPRNFPA